MNKKLLIIIGVTLLITLLVLLLIKPSNKEDTKNSRVTPTITPGVTRVQSQTGAEVITRTPKEEKMSEKLKNLRLAAPIDTGDFIISMNWTDAIFEVKSKTEKTVDQAKLETWLQQNGYGDISMDNFKFIE